MGKIYHITEDYSERRGGFRGHHEDEEERILEKAFKEGCEHGYKKAMRELEGFDERGGRMGRSNYREGFEEKIEKLKEKYK